PVRPPGCKGGVRGHCRRCRRRPDRCAARGGSARTVLSPLRPARRCRVAGGDRRGGTQRRSDHRAGEQCGERPAARLQGRDGRLLGRTDGRQSAPQFFAIQAIAPMMRSAGGGSIINFGSISWHTNHGDMPAYTTAKAAVEGLTKGMARDLGVDGIRVNTVIPGWIMTERQIKLWLTPEAEANLIRSQCLKTKLVPADVARLVLWLASDDSRMCSAQLWVVDGGRL